MKSPCYCAVLRAASRKTTALYDAALAPAGLTLAQYSLMRRIERAGSPSLTELGRLAELDRSTVGRNVRLLEKLGFAEVSGGEDPREAAVALTALGRATLAAAQPMWSDAQREVERRLGPDAARALRELAAAL